MKKMMLVVEGGGGVAVFVFPFGVIFLSFF